MLCTYLCVFVCVRACVRTYVCLYAYLQSTLFPERGTVFDFFFQKKGSTWNSWDDLIKKVDIRPGAKVRTYVRTPVLCKDSSSCLGTAVPIVMKRFHICT